MEVAAGVHQIDGVRGAHSFLVLGEQLTLIDAGMRGSSGPVVEYIQKLNRRPKDLSLVILTHYHTDHTGGANEIKRILKPQVAAGEAEIPYISGKLPPPLREDTRLPKVARNVINMLFPFIPTSVDIPLQDNEEIDAAGGMRVINVPGHTPGSICLYMPAQKVLFAGDALTNRGGRLTVAPAPFTLDAAEAKESAKRLAELDVDTIVFGHGQALKCRAGEALRGLLQ